MNGIDEFIEAWDNLPEEIKEGIRAIDLNPCPFCNTTPILQHSPETGFYIHCPTCQSYTHGVQWSREEALAVWNNRPDETGITDWKLHKAMAGFRLDIMEKQAERIAALESENAKLRDPWVRIDPERPETLPPYTEYTKILITQLVEGKPVSGQGYYDGLQFRQVNGSFIPLSLVVAWQPFPEPAVYEESE